MSKIWITHFCLPVGFFFFLIEIHYNAVFLENKVKKPKEELLSQPIKFISKPALGLTQLSKAELEVKKLGGGCQIFLTSAIFICNDYKQFNPGLLFKLALNSTGFTINCNEINCKHPPTQHQNMENTHPHQYLYYMREFLNHCPLSYTCIPNVISDREKARP